MPDPKVEDWLLNFHKLSGKTIIEDRHIELNPFLKGLPFGYGTAMAKRYDDHKLPWDEGCKVTPLIGGYEAMGSMRAALLKVAEDAEAPGTNPDDKGHVCIMGWRLNRLRDLSITGNSDPNETPYAIFKRLLQAGVFVRVLLWYQGWFQKWGGFRKHRHDHLKQAQDFRDLLIPLNKENLGIVGLDLRVGSFAGAHHQKMMVIRSKNVNLAFCGGVDLAFTRRDTPDDDNPFDPDNPKFYGGDNESGEKIPGDVPTDLPEEVYGDGQAPKEQKWHDQHLRLEGPIVSSLEEQFWERWTESGRAFSMETDQAAIFNNQVIFSSYTAVDGEREVILRPFVTPEPGIGQSLIQMWRTIPSRPRPANDMFKYGEFTAMAGISNACLQSKQLIWIFEQYFFSRPIARLLFKQLRENPQLHVIIILPPYADTVGHESISNLQHRARKLALNDLIRDNFTPVPLDTSNEPVSRVAVYDLWDNRPEINLGIYCHAKVQMYDDALLVVGSANLNRRSFTGDSEVDCAIFDKSVVQTHRKKLWKLLFPDVLWIEEAKQMTIDFNAEGSGKLFFDYFKENVIAGSPKSFLIEDKWKNEYGHPIILPNHSLERDQDTIEDNPSGEYSSGTIVLDLNELKIAIDHFKFNHFIETSSISTKIENGRASLDTIVKRLYIPDDNGKLHYL